MKITLRLALTAIAFAAGALIVRAQDAPAAPAGQTSPADTSDSSSDSPTTFFPHSKTSRFWISGQANIILQWHPAFHAAYSGPNSFRAFGENATSKVYTLYTGFALTHMTEIFVDAESAGGHGLSEALGLAGFTNLDVVRNPALGPAPYLARLEVRQIIPLSSERVEAERGPFALATSLPARRIEIRVGKMGLVDFFDANTGGSDSHLQFLNWTVDNNGAYDYAANTRGYTDAAIFEFDSRSWSLRFAEAMMPKVANGLHLDADLFRAHSESYEAEWRETFLAGRSGVIRLLGFENHADMGNYREAIDDFLAGQVSRPDIIATRQQGRVKYGFGLNVEQDLTKEFGLFARLGWSDGRNESFAYTEVDRTVEIGSYFHGESWHRKNDHAGAVFTMNGIVADHARYLALGGLGFLLGDGGLTYGHEKIFEGYYTAHAWRGIFASFDLQHVNNPGYNKDRGPAVVPGLRLHLDF